MSGSLHINLLVTNMIGFEQSPYPILVLAVTHREYVTFPWIPFRITIVSLVVTVCDCVVMFVTVTLVPGIV